jgi:hypothetical protein
MKIYFSAEDFRENIWKSVLLFLALIVALVCLFYVFGHNPHKTLQEDIFASAGKIHSYYREKPGYWQLSTNTALEDGLIVDSLKQYKEYDVQIGQGLDGESGLPSDMSFNIVLKHLNKSACINLSELPINKDAQLILQKITIINDAKTAEFAWGSENPLPISRYTTRDICQPTENTLVWTFN